MNDVGGNIIKQLSFAKDEFLFAEDSYTYYWKTINSGQNLKLSQLGSFSVYVLSLKPDAFISINETNQSMLQGDLLQVEGQSVELSASGPAEILIAGTKSCLSKSSQISLTKAAKIKKVTKPWGHELWLNGEHPGYAFKQLFVKKGARLSLQYHRMKRETVVLFSGKANLHYKSNPKTSNDTVQAQDISQYLIEAPCSVDVFPDVLHRYEALSDLLFYEVSTPHFDDVVRVSDDSNRPDGRIDTEHTTG